MEIKMTVLAATLAMFIAPLAADAARPTAPPHSNNGSLDTISHNDCECGNWVFSNADAILGTSDDWTGECKIAWTSSINWDTYGADFVYEAVLDDVEYGGSAEISPFVCDDAVTDETCWSGETLGEAEFIPVSLPAYPEGSEITKVGLSIKGFENNNDGPTARSWLKTFDECDAGNLPPAGDGQ